MRLHLVVSISLLHVARSLPHASRDEGQWSLAQNGTTGVSAMQLAVVSSTLAIIFDKIENNPIQINGQPVWGSLFNFETNTASPLKILTNSFCASGTLISNGTLVNTGGTPPPPAEPDGAIQALRIFEPCNSPTGEGCTVFEDPNTVHMARGRWYPTTIRIPDGSAMIIGGTMTPNFYDTNVTASYEFFPPKNGGEPIPSPFLVDSLPSNLFPLAFTLPDGKIMLVANNKSIIYDLETNTEMPLPTIPNGVRVTNPLPGAGVLLGLSPPDYTPEVLVCGGMNIDDSIQAQNISNQQPASNQCIRMEITPEGIARGWEVDFMPDARIMPEAILMPNGQVVIVNGAQTGISGIAVDPTKPLADNPAFTPSLYTPSNPLGQRFTNSNMPTSNIARMYHSSATLTPNGNVMIAGSNPNLDVAEGVRFPTEFRAEFLSPPFMAAGVPRPSLGDLPRLLGFGETISIPVSIPDSLNGDDIQISLMDFGFSTHGSHSGQRLVFLVGTLSEDRQTLSITGPPNKNIYPPGPGFIFLTVDGVTSKAGMVTIGTGATPPIA